MNSRSLSAPRHHKGFLRCTQPSISNLAGEKSTGDFRISDHFRRNSPPWQPHLANSWPEVRLGAKAQRESYLLQMSVDQ